MTPMRDTIAAIATATGGGVGMVRLSGPQALAVAGRVFRPMNPAKSPETMPGYTGAFGRVCHGEQLLDEAVLFVYHAPHSYTGEDVAEFCCHGGEFVLSQVLAAVIAAGARPAEAGEYTRRALEQCDLILAVFDESRPLTPEECEWLPQLSGRAAVVIYNKQDLPPALTAEEKAAIAAVAPVSVSISAAAGTGLAELTEAIRQVVGLSHFDPTAAIIANARQLECITAARRSLGEGIEALTAGETLDAVSVCLEQAADALLTLTGRRASAEAIDKVFEQFCVGK